MCVIVTALPELIHICILRLVASTLGRALRRVTLQLRQLSFPAQLLRKLLCRESSLDNTSEYLFSDHGGNEGMDLL